MAQPKPYSNIVETQGRGKDSSVAQAAVVGGLVGAAIGAGAVFASKLPKEPEDENK